MLYFHYYHNFQPSFHVPTSKLSSMFLQIQLQPKIVVHVIMGNYMFWLYIRSPHAATVPAYEVLWIHWTWRDETITNIKHIFYHGYCKDQWNAAVIIYVIPRYVTMGYEKWYTSLLLKQCEEICAFEVQNHANYM